MAVPAMTSACPVSARPVSSPSTSAPLMFTTKVPIGKRLATRSLSAPSSTKRAIAPAPPTSATATQAGKVMPGPPSGRPSL